MRLDNFVLLLVLVVGAAILTGWVSMIALTALQVPWGWLVIIPAGLVGYVVWRVVADRLGNAEDDHYDKIEK